MATAILVYNGLHFPAGILDNALAWATSVRGNLIALFVVSDKDQEGGYPFPNDLDEAEEVQNDADAMGTDLAVIASNIRLLRHQATNAKLQLETRILPDPNPHTIHEWLQKGDMVFLPGEPLDPPVLSIKPAELKRALEGIAAKQEWVEA